MRFAVIDQEVRPTGATKHSYGQVIDEDVVPGPPMEPFAALAIGQYADDSAYYLLYLNADWDEVTDTWHKTLDDAMHQAEFEYERISAKWENLPGVSRHLYPAPTLREREG